MKRAGFSQLCHIEDDGVNPSLAFITITRWEENTNEFEKGHKTRNERNQLPSVDICDDFCTLVFTFTFLHDFFLQHVLLYHCMCAVLCCVVWCSDLTSLPIKQTKHWQLVWLHVMFSALSITSASLSCGDVEESEEPSQLLFHGHPWRNQPNIRARTWTRVWRGESTETRTATAADLQQYSHNNDAQHLLRVFASSVPPDRCQTGVQFAGESSDARARSYRWHVRALLTHDHVSRRVLSSF